MRILLFSLYFVPDIASTGVLMTQLCEDLQKMGHEITVVTTFPHYIAGQIWPEYRRKIIEKASHNGIRILRTYIYASDNKEALPGRVLNYGSFNVLSTIVGLFSGRQDVIIAPSPPLTIGLAAYLVSRAKGIPFIYNLQDIYPEVAVKLGALKSRPFISFFERMERFVYDKAEHVTVLSKGFCDNLLRKGVPGNKITIIPNFADTDFIKPLPKVNDFSKRHGLSDKFVVMHAGNVGFSQDLAGMLECAKLLYNEARIEFVIVGDGAAKASLQEEARRMRLDNVRFLSFQPREDLPHLRAAADVQVALLKQGIAASSVPCKVYEIMASGRPVIAGLDPGSDTWELIREARCGICIEPENPQELANAVLTLYHDEALRRKLAQNGRRFVVENNSRQIVAQKYHDLLQSIVTT